MRRLGQSPTDNLRVELLFPQVIVLADVLAPQVLRVLNREDILPRELLVRQQVAHVLRLEIELLHRLPAVDVPGRPHRHDIRVLVEPAKGTYVVRRTEDGRWEMGDGGGTRSKQHKNKSRGTPRDTTYTLPSTGQQISPCGLVEKLILVTSLNSNGAPVIGCA